MAGTAQRQPPAWAKVTASVRNISLDRKPLNNGTPAMAAVAVMASVEVHGISRHSPPSLRMSRVPVSWSMMPAVMNKAALKVAWFKI